ncbi:hypothetical protein [Microcystis phage vB_MweS-yong2]|nr:hypothetical protein [Microcystis phage vB_MweS-yong2]
MMHDPRDMGRAELDRVIRARHEAGDLLKHIGADLGLSAAEVSRRAIRAGARRRRRFGLRDALHRDRAILTLRAAGMTINEIAAELGCCSKHVGLVVRASRPAPGRAGGLHVRIVWEEAGDGLIALAGTVIVGEILPVPQRGYDFVARLPAAGAPLEGAAASLEEAKAQVALAMRAFMGAAGLRCAKAAAGPNDCKDDDEGGAP